jgi:polar amino acid transport system substrate-binding protein
MSLSLSLVFPGFLALSPPSVDAADLAAIRRRGRLVVAVKSNLPPLGFRDPAGNLQGFEIDLARQVAKELLGDATAIEFRSVLNQDRFNTVLQGEVDLAIAQMTQTPSRLRLFNFSLPYYRDGAAIATRIPTIRTVSDLTGQRIAVLNGSSTAEILRRQIPTAVLIPVSSYHAGKALVEAGGAVAIAADASVLAGLVQQFPSYRLLTPVLSAENLAVVLPKGQQYEELRQEVDRILTRLSASGWLIERATYWGLPRNLSF